MKIPQQIKILIICLLVIPLELFAQNDSLHQISLEQFISIVEKYHPIVKQSNLVISRAKSEVDYAKGGWDPQINSQIEQKKYDGKNYYSYFENNIKIPSWYGIDFKVGYDVTSGNNLNIESKLPNDGLAYLGVSIPLLKNLIIDKRRATLRQANLVYEMSEQEKTIIVNDLMLQAKYCYYDWVLAYNELKVYEYALQLAQDRFKATKLLSEFGDRPSIDTVEALTQLQARQYQLNDAIYNFTTKSLELNNYLWFENENAYQFDSLLVPEFNISNLVMSNIDLKTVKDFEISSFENHPQIISYNLKLKQLDIDRKLKIENLKPTLNLNYNLLAQGFNYNNYGENEFKNNYKVGLNFSLPLTFMQGRAELKMSNIKISDTEYQLALKKREMINKLNTYYNQLINLQSQNNLYEQTVSNFQILLQGEEIRFQNGESSIFLVNARENKLIESKLKLTEIKTKYYKTEAMLRWSLGSF